MEININPVVIPHSQKRIMIPQGKMYQIYISMPLHKAPLSGFPVIYLLDAHSVFGTMTETIRAQSRFPDRTGVEPAIVIGIAYETDAPFHPSRHYDFTDESHISVLPLLISQGIRFSMKNPL